MTNVENIDEAPEFAGLPQLLIFRRYEHELKAGASIIHNLGVHVSNDDNKHLRYEVIFPNEDDGFFKVRGGLGHRAELYVAKDVDFETSTSHDPTRNVPGEKSYKFKIRVSQVDNADLYDEQDVTIIVTDVNDEAPVLTAYDSKGAVENGKTPTGHITENADGVDAGISFSISDADDSNVADYVEAGETSLLTEPIDPDSFTITGTQADKFTLEHSTGDLWKLKLKPREQLDHEIEDVIILHISVNDGTHESDVMKLRIIVDDVIEPPVITRHNSGDIEVSENDAGAEIGYVLKLIEHEAHESPSFRITDSDGNDQSHRFEVVRDGSDDFGNTLWKIKLKTGVFLDYETDPNIALVVVADDGVSDSDPLKFTLNVVNVVNEVIRFTIPENVPNQYVVGTFNLHEATDTSIYEITAGNDDDIFTIGTFSGVISVVDAGALDFETTSTYSLTITQTIPGVQTITRTATAIINLENVNDEEPDIFTSDSTGNLLTEITLEENQQGVDTGLFFTISDADTNDIDAFEFTISSDDAVDQSHKFSKPIYVRSYGENNQLHLWKLKLDDAYALDYEEASQVRLKITVNDGDNESTYDTAIINVGDVNDVAPVITASFQQPGGMVSENTMGAETGITLTVADSDTAQSDLRFALHDDGDGGIADKLELVRRGDDWVLKLKDGAMLDTETAIGTLAPAGIFSEITVTVSDGVQSHELALPLFINDENDNLPKLHLIDDVGVAHIAESATGLNTNIVFAISDADISQAFNIQNHFDLHISGDQADKFTFKNVYFGYNIGADAYDVSNGNFWQLKLEDEAELVYDSTDPAANRLTLSVHASDAKHSSNSIEITINIIEVDDGLVFTQGRYNAYVQENENAGVVTTVEAISDAPLGDNFRYSITSGDAGIFSIGEKSGVISHNGVLDAETLQQYNLNVQASDGTKIATTMVAVRIIDVNEHDVSFGADAVAFASDFANGVVSEATSVGRILATVTATDQDVNTRLTYSISGGNDDNFFAIDAATGAVRLARALDYETATAHQIQITASDGRYSDTTNIDFSVTEADNQFPLLISVTKAGQITENIIGADSGISFLVADLESADTPRFIIHGGQSNKFELVQTTAPSGSVIWALKLKTGVYLDYEEDAHIELSITGDNGFQRTNSIDVSIDVVDTEPETYTINVAESAEIGDALAVLSVFDVGTSGITYSIASGNDAGVFRLDGNILRLASALDYEDAQAAKNYTILVNISDGTTTRTATLNIAVVDANDNAPTLTEAVVDARGAVAENVAGADTGIAFIRADADSDAVNVFTHSITSDDALDQSGLFRLVEDAGLWRLKLIEGAVLDYEDASVVALDIKVNDGVADSDSIRVYVDVEDVNDVAPRITASFQDPIGSGMVSENVMGAETGITLNVADSDTAQSDLRFTLHDNGDGGIADKLELVRRGDDWVLKLKDGAMLDAESTGPWSEITVTVSDGVHSSKLPLSLFINDENDNLPKLHLIDDVGVAHIAESEAGLNTNIVFAISDADISQALNIQGYFDLHISGDQADKFTYKNVDYRYNIGADAYDVSDGNFWQLKLDDEAELVYDSTDPAANSLTLYVHASDTKHSSNSIEITINIIEVDDGLVFTQGRYNAYVDESKDTGDVTTVKAISDAPLSDNFRYSITSGDAGIFSIGEKSGVISLNGALDAETLQQYNLNVQASDGTKIATTMVVVRIFDVNEHDVSFGADAVAFASDFANGVVSEATSVGRILATVTATDQDVNARITYSISGGNDDNFFAIDAATGAVRLARALDYETATAHQIQITASDGRYSDTTNIDFSVTEADNQFPLLISITKAGQITENIIGADSGISFLVADLESADTPRFIIHGGQSNKFELVQTTAPSGSVIWALKLKTGVYLDYEEDAHIELSITGDNGFQRTNSIDVSIDVVDTEPETYTINVAESAEIDDALAVLSVFDVGTSGITYSIASGNDAGVFRLDGNTLHLASALDYEDAQAAKNYSIVVNISDGTTTRMATLNIEVVDENDNAPQLTEAVVDARGAVAENVMGADTGIAFIRADADSDAVNVFTHSITSDDALDQSGLFRLVEDAGLWRLKLIEGAVLDYELASVVALDIKVNDGVADSDSIRVYVDVEDANDVAPILTPIQRAGAVDENDAGAETGVQFSVADADSAVEDFTFSITDDAGLDQSGLFGMTHISTDADGVSLWNLTLQDGMALNYEQAALAGLNIKVSDGVADSESFYVVITVNDVDEPIGLVGDLAGEVQEAANPATPISVTGAISGYNDPENILPIATADAIVVKDADSGGALSKTGQYGVFSFTPAADGEVGFGQWRYVLDGHNLAVRALNDGEYLSESFTLTYTLTSGGVSITRDEAITLTILGRDSDIYFVDDQNNEILDAQGDAVSVLGDAVHEFNIERGRDALNGGLVLGALSPKIGGAVDTDNIEIALADAVSADVAQHFSVNADGELVFTGSKDDIAEFAPQFNVDLVARAPQETAEELAFHVAINLINEFDDGRAGIAIRGSDGAPINSDSDLANLDVGWMLTGAVTSADPDGVVGVPSWRWFHTSDPEKTIGTGASYQVEESDRRKIIGVEHSYNDGSRADDFVSTTTLEVAVPRLKMSVPDSEKDKDQTLIIPDGNNGAELQGGNGADTITAGDGDDYIEGGLGDDAIDLEKDTNDQDEVMYRIGNRYNRDGGDDITNFNRGQDTLIFSIDSRDAEANGFTLQDGASIDDFILYLQNNTPDDLSDDQFLVMLNFDFDSPTASLLGLSFHFQDSVFYAGGRISMPIMRVDFAEPMGQQEIVDAVTGGGASFSEVLFRNGVLKDLNYLDDFLGGADSLGFSVSDVL